MANYLKLTLIGRVGRDPELRMTQNGKAVCNFSVAVNRRVKQGDPEITDWYRCAAWGDSAERAQQYITKGRLVFVEGGFEPRTYVDRSGEKQLSLDVNVREWQLLDRKPDVGVVDRSDAMGDADTSLEPSPF